MAIKLIVAVSRANSDHTLITSNCVFQQYSTKIVFSCVYWDNWRKDGEICYKYWNSLLWT